jgi:iron complex outermembrane receptor protein
VFPAGLLAALFSAPASGQTPAPRPAAPAPAATPQADGSIFTLGEIVTVVSTPIDPVGVGGSIVTADEIRTFDKTSLEQAVNLVPGVTSTLDANGRRNESDIFVRGFGRWQVPLTIDGIRVYLPADNRLDFSRFLTADVAAVQIRKGYASVLDGPGAMGGSINLVTRTPSKAFDAEASVSTGGRESSEGWNGYAMAGTRRERYYAQGSVNYQTRDFWSLPSSYAVPANSLQPAGRRLSADTRDWRANAKVGFTPNATDEYTLNYTKQSGQKGAPLNVYNNPPVPANGFWRWPVWDVSSLSLLTDTHAGADSYIKSKIYYNTLTNALDAYDDITYSTQATSRAFHSPYDDKAYGASVELGTASRANAIKAALHYRADRHLEQQTNRQSSPTFVNVEPEQKQGQNTWSIALEDTLHVGATLDLVGGVSYDRYEVTKAEEYNATQGVFEYPKGGSDAFNWQAAAVWRVVEAGEFHASVSDRARFPIFFELYSTRFGTATPNPDLGPERARNFEIGSKKDLSRRGHVSAAVFYSQVRDLIQAVILSDTTSQTQNVGNGHFDGAELAADGQVSDTLRVGANYTFIRRVITDALQPTLRPTGVPTHKGMLFATWQPARALTISPSLELAGDRWSEINPVPAGSLPYVRTGAYRLFNLDATYAITRVVSVSAGFKNAGDDYYELAWGLPQPGRTFYVRTRIAF